MLGIGPFDIVCKCSYSFCWNVSISVGSFMKRVHSTAAEVRCCRLINWPSLKLYTFVKCLEEAHRPVDCDTVAKWILKNCAESENMNWYFFMHIIVYLVYLTSFFSKLDRTFCFWPASIFDWTSLGFFCPYSGFLPIQSHVPNASDQ